jgi:hypothetical protein
MKPIHKFNNGNGATLCHNCIISIWFTEDLYCKECNNHKKEFGRLIEKDGVLFDTYLDKPYEEGQIVNMRDYPAKILMVKGFENEESKQEALEELRKWEEEALIAHEINQEVIEKLMAERKLMYSEEELINISIQYFNHYYNISSRGRLIIDHDLEWFEQFKNK